METTRFVEDIFLPRLLYCRTIRSPVAKGRLLSIECPRLPNGYTFITAKDIPGVNRLVDTALPVLAESALSYAGEPVALLTGPDITKLDELLGQYRVIAEEEPPVFSGGDVSAGTIVAERTIAAGDTDEVFRQTHAIVESEYRTGIQEHWYAEASGALVCFDSKGDGQGKKQTGNGLLVYAATQWPHHVKRAVADALGLDANAVRVKSTMLGIHMDGKIWYPSLIACHAALCAFITKKPVKLVLTKKEDFLFSPKRNSTVIKIKSAVDDKGAILGAEIDVTADLGAGGIKPEEILDQTCLGALSIYQLENVQLSGRALKTNIPPQSAFTGFGLAQGLFAAEQHVSHIADMRGQNPSEWRKEHYSRNGTLPPGLVIRENPPAEKLLDTAASMSDYNRKWAAYELIRQTHRNNGWNVEKGENLRGIGIALGYQGAGFLYSGADNGGYGVELTLEKDGSLEINAVINSTDNDFPRIWANIAATILGIDAARVRLKPGADIANSGPSCASRNITALTKLVEHACLDIRKQRFRDPLPITVRRSQRPRKNSQWEKFLPPPEGKRLDAGGFIQPGWAAAVVEVEIDPVEYVPRARGVWLSIDGGKIFNEEKARRNLKIAAVQALGWAYREQINYLNGRISRAQFENYDIPNPADIPPIHIEFTGNDSADARGIGELPFTCLPAAFLQAACQSMDHHFHSIPLTSQDIWEVMIAKQGEAPA
ncbi:MAG TPA: xanthine dehydrogenase [Treponema sp.]|nr:xanthine dehydrogenase [Treponema sp.]